MKTEKMLWVEILGYPLAAIVYVNAAIKVIPIIMTTDKSSALLTAIAFFAALWMLMIEFLDAVDDLETGNYL